VLLEWAEGQKECRNRALIGCRGLAASQWALTLPGCSDGSDGWRYTPRLASPPVVLDERCRTTSRCLTSFVDMNTRQAHCCGRIATKNPGRCVSWAISTGPCAFLSLVQSRSISRHPLWVWLPRHPTGQPRVTSGQESPPFGPLFISQLGCRNSSRRRTAKKAREARDNMERDAVTHFKDNHCLHGSAWWQDGGWRAKHFGHR
jgi:hypothetical protein